LGIELLGQRLNDWSELPPRDGIINPGWKLEWERYSQWMDDRLFLPGRLPSSTSTKRSEQFVMHDFAGPPRPEVNEPDVVKSLDIRRSKIRITGTQTNSMVKVFLCRGLRPLAQENKLPDHRNQC